MNFKGLENFKPGRFGFYILVFTFTALFTVVLLPSSQNNIAAVVNGQNILKGTYDNLYNSQKYYFETVYPQKFNKTVPINTINSLPRVVIDELIQETLLHQYLAKNNIFITDNQVKEAVKTQVVDPQWKGNWTAYQNDLFQNYRTTLDNIMHSFRIGLMIRKSADIANVKPVDFQTWYDKLRKDSNVKILLAEYNNTK